MPRKAWYQDIAFWVVCISFLVFLATAASLIYTYQASGGEVKRFRPVPTVTPHSHWCRFSVDARNEHRWVYFSFTRGIVHPRFVSSTNWDLAFKRYHIMANGGASNLAARGGILDVGEGDIPREIPEAGYVLNTMTPNRQDFENAAVRHWYDYDYVSHILTPKPHLYLVRTPDRLAYALRILSYYCNEVEAGCLTFEYRQVK